MLTLDDAEYPPVAFLAGFPGGTQLSRLLDPRSVREAKAGPDAEVGKEAVDREMDNLKSCELYGLVPRAPGTRTLHRKLKV
jgi:hypothetical protein